MEERLQKIISSSGLMSRRAAEELISAGKVRVNGETAHLGDKADVQCDSITVQGKPLAKQDRKCCLMLNKPAGYVTTLSDEKGRKTVAQLIKDAGVRVYPVGRLDMYSEGLLLFTNDGELANAMMHPSFDISKTYLLQVKGSDVPSKIKLLRKPIEIDGKMTSPAQVSVVSQSETEAELSVTIHEGRNRQIRRLCENAELKVVSLKRISEGVLSLGDLKPGKWRYLSASEEELLRGSLKLK